MATMNDVTKILGEIFVGKTPTNIYPWSHGFHYSNRNGTRLKEHDGKNLESVLRDLNFIK